MVITLNISVDSALWGLLIIEAYSHFSHQYGPDRIISTVDGEISSLAMLQNHKVYLSGRLNVGEEKTEARRWVARFVFGGFWTLCLSSLCVFWIILVVLRTSRWAEETPHLYASALSYRRH